MARWNTYNYAYHVPHTPVPNGPYGSNGNFVFDVPGRTGMGIHSGRSGPQSKTLGCIRTTDGATDFLGDVNAVDPITQMVVSHDGSLPQAPFYSGYWMNQLGPR